MCSSEAIGGGEIRWSFLPAKSGADLQASASKGARRCSNIARMASKGMNWRAGSRSRSCGWVEEIESLGMLDEVDHVVVVAPEHGYEMTFPVQRCLEAAPERVGGVQLFGGGNFRHPRALARDVDDLDPCLVWGKGVPKGLDMAHLDHRDLYVLAIAFERFFCRLAL